MTQPFINTLSGLELCTVLDCKPRLINIFSSSFVRLTFEGGLHFFNKRCKKNYFYQNIRWGDVQIQFAPKARESANCTFSPLKQYNIVMSVIPGGCTKYLQRLDVCINKPFA